MRAASPRLSRWAQRACRSAALICIVRNRRSQRPHRAALESAGRRQHCGDQRDHRSAGPRHRPPRDPRGRIDQPMAPEFPLAAGARAVPPKRKRREAISRRQGRGKLRRSAALPGADLTRLAGRRNFAARVKSAGMCRSNIALRASIRFRIVLSQTCDSDGGAASRRWRSRSSAPPIVSERGPDFRGAVKRRDREARGFWPPATTTPSKIRRAATGCCASTRDDAIWRLHRAWRPDAAHAAQRTRPRCRSWRRSAGSESYGKALARGRHQPAEIHRPFHHRSGEDRRRYAKRHRHDVRPNSLGHGQHGQDAGRSGVGTAWRDRPEAQARGEGWRRSLHRLRAARPEAVAACRRRPPLAG